MEEFLGLLIASLSGMSAIVSALKLLREYNARRKQETPAAPISIFLPLTFVCSMVTLLWIAYGMIIQSAFPSDLEDAGRFGDMFGGFSALMSALGFAAVVTSMWAQAQQFRHERIRQDSRLEEERTTRREMDERQEKQLIVMQAQLEALSEQREMDRANFERAAEPNFSFCQSIEYNPNYVELRNAGGKITAIRLLPGTRIRLQHESRLINGGAALLDRNGVRDSEPMDFALEYMRAADRTVKQQTFTFAFGQLPVPIHDRTAAG